MSDNSNMAENSENGIYDALMRLKPEDLTPNAWAVRAGVSRTVWSDMRRHDNPSRTTLQKLLAPLGMTLAQFEAMRASDAPTAPQNADVAYYRVGSEVRGTGLSAHDVEHAWRGPAPSKPIPLVGSAIGGEWDHDHAGVELTELYLGDVLDYLGRPSWLAGDQGAYAVTIVGESMAPRYEPGERAYVSPRAPVSIGDDVIVQLKGSARDDQDAEDSDRVTMVLIKRLSKRTGGELELEQFNPPTRFAVPLSRVAAIHRVRGRS